LGTDINLAKRLESARILRGVWDSLYADWRNAKWRNAWDYGAMQSRSQFRF